MPGKTLGIVFAILVLVVLALGTIFYDVSRRAQQPLAQSQNQETSSPNGEDTQQTTPGSTTELSESERKALNAPGENASQEEKDKHSVLLNSMARESATLDITSCDKPAPLILKAKLGTEITIVNNDDVPHAITVVGTPYKVESKSSIALKLDFGKGEGTYGYVCDAKGQGDPPVSGYFYITK